MRNPLLAERPAPPSAFEPDPLPVFAEGAVTTRQRHLGCGEAERGGGGDLLVGEAVQPAPDGGEMASVEVVGQVRPDQLARSLDFPRRDPVLDRLGEIVMLGVPDTCPAVQRTFALRLLVTQLRLQHLGEQGVVAVCVVASIERNEERVRARKIAKHLRRTRSLEHGVADGAGECVEHRGARQELELASRQSREKLVPKVVDNQAVSAGEARHRSAGVALPAKRQSRQINRNGPALGSPKECCDVRGTQLQTHPRQQVATFGSRHRQISLLQLGEPTVRPPAAELQRGFSSRGKGDLGAAG